MTINCVALESNKCELGIHLINPSVDEIEQGILDCELKEFETLWIHSANHFQYQVIADGIINAIYPNNVIKVDFKLKKAKKVS